MTHPPHTHIDEVYVCFLPFHYGQWVPTENETVNKHVEIYYLEKHDALDIVDEELRIVGINLDNPKRFSMEQQLLLHDTVVEVLTDLMNASITVNFNVLTKYFDEPMLKALAWTVKFTAPATITAYQAAVSEELIESMKNLTSVTFKDDLIKIINGLKGTMTEFTQHELYQLLPACSDKQAAAIEWRTGDIVRNVLLIPIDLNTELPDLIPLILAVQQTDDVSVLFVIYHQEENQIDRIARSGIAVSADENTSAVLFDMLHYGFQYNVQPVVLMISSVNKQRMTTYGESLSLQRTAYKYRIQTPEYQLFPSDVIREKQIAMGLVSLSSDSYDSYAHYYHKPFSLLKIQVKLPIYFMIQIYHSLFHKG
ncbi:hypothetical protein [Macrococcus lamae]|uniref:Uncharacterized protein n=1 Tax=Macrococcus lamae TaxID=198484 RepID=A0A4R6BX03_9STAP|nr:hypothetical protein [Macrococcus lamae]TDM12536.1 hypothetical protein ERX29_02700 [Macrococcus lamae]